MHGNGTQPVFQNARAPWAGTRLPAATARGVPATGEGHGYWSRAPPPPPTSSDRFIVISNFSTLGVTLGYLLFVFKEIKFSLKILRQHMTHHLLWRKNSKRKKSAVTESAAGWEGGCACDPVLPAFVPRSATSVDLSHVNFYVSCSLTNWYKFFTLIHCLVMF